jgi:hypothetical protein
MNFIKNHLSPSKLLQHDNEVAVSPQSQDTAYRINDGCSSNVNLARCEGSHQAAGDSVATSQLIDCHISTCLETKVNTPFACQSSDNSLPTFVDYNEIIRLPGELADLKLLMDMVFKELIVVKMEQRSMI